MQFVDLLFISQVFLSTPSARRATDASGAIAVRIGISIHALREEGDMQDRTGSYGQQNFYPRPPRGGRPNTAYQRAVEDIFLSTPSARRATICVCINILIGCLISIHALREEGDVALIKMPQKLISFLSTPSARRATAWLSDPVSFFVISIHALREEGDVYSVPGLDTI